MSEKYKFTALLLSLLFVFSSSAVVAQAVKPGVLVIGGTPAGLAAAIQSANSGVKTVLVDEGAMESVSLSPENRRYRIGIYGDLIKRVEDAQKFPVREDQELGPAFVGRMFKAWTDTLKNLTVITGATVSQVEKKGKSWELTLSNKTQVKADAVVDATDNRRVMQMASVTEKAIPVKNVSRFYQDKVYRTGVALVDSAGRMGTLPVSALITSENNFFIAGNSLVNASFATGQAAGATAAYCSFFNTNAEKLNIRLIQSELITYRSRLLDFEDVDMRDSNVVAIHNVALSGILKGVERNGRLYFIPDSTVSSQDLKEPVKEYYSRSQIWFLDHETAALTLEELLSLIKFAASRGNELDREVEKGWKTSLKLPGEFDLKKPVTRREAAVLINAYLRPFSVNIGMNGELKR